MSKPQAWFDKVKYLYIVGEKKNSKFARKNVAAVPVTVVETHPEYDQDYMAVYNGEDYAEFHNMEQNVMDFIDTIKIKAIECPKCHKMTFVRNMRQTRSGDEGESCISLCRDDKCGFKQFER